MVIDYKMTNILLIEKTGEIKEAKLKEFTLDALYKKCKFRKSDGFEQRHVWKVSMSGTTYNIAVYARNYGKSGMENKYDLPPPIDEVLYFGIMAIVSLNPDNHEQTLDLSEELWLKIYEKLFGGFHNLADTAVEDEEEEDELASLPSELKTKDGYLKDDFIVEDHLSSKGTSVSESPEAEETDEYESELDFEEYEYLDSNDEESKVYLSDE